MNEVVKVVQQAGLVQSDTVQELQRWGAPVETAPPCPEVPAETVPYVIERAIQSRDFVEVHETDLEIMQQYLSTQQPAVLHIDHLSGLHESADVLVGITPAGKYIIPWTGERITDALFDCVLELAFPTRKGHVPLGNPQELFFGERKMFVVWTPMFTAWAQLDGVAAP